MNFIRYCFFLCGKKCGYHELCFFYNLIFIALFPFGCNKEKIKKLEQKALKFVSSRASNGRIIIMCLKGQMKDRIKLITFRARC
jgi:hypothetical protein